jgi:hypothetical protein
MDQIYKLTVQVGNVSVGLESSDKDWVAAKESQYISHLTEKLKTHSHSVQAPERPLDDTPAPVPNADMTVGEFYKKYIKAANVTTRPDIAVFFVYYLQKISKREDIRTQDVIQCFAEIGYPGYNKLNVTDILSKAKRKALLNCVNNIWRLTVTGEDYVVNAITNEA